jgi:hypothetical protein
MADGSPDFVTLTFLYLFLLSYMETIYETLQGLNNG